MTWPNNPLDRHTPCGLCARPILVAAYDFARVDPGAFYAEHGECHLACIFGVPAVAPDTKKAKDPLLIVDE